MRREIPAIRETLQQQIVGIRIREWGISRMQPDTNLSLSMIPACSGEDFREWTDFGCRVVKMDSSSTPVWRKNRQRVENLLGYLLRFQVVHRECQWCLSIQYKSRCVARRQPFLIGQHRA